jgi:hypothetical protein
LAGLIAVVIGSFLPWLISGGVLRNSFSIVGIVRRLGVAGTGFAASALAFWPLLGPVVMLPVIAGIVRWWRTAAVLTMIIGLVTGVLSGGVLLLSNGRRALGIGLALPGPVCTAVGSCLAVVGAVVVLVAGRRPKPAAIAGFQASPWPAPGPSFESGRPPDHDNISTAPNHVSAEPSPDSLRRTANKDGFTSHRPPEEPASAEQRRPVRHDASLAYVRTETQ